MSDLHGNHVALAAVLADAAARGVERWLVLGDVVAMGSDPVGVLELLDTIEVCVSVAGNTERYVLTGSRPDPTFDQVIANPSELPRLVEVTATFAWTKGFLSATRRLGDLEDYVANWRCTLPDGTRLLAVHASLVSDEGAGISPDLENSAVETLFPDHDADVIVGGHTHRRTDRALRGVRFVNPGSISNHDEPHLPATYSILDADADGHSFSHQDVSYSKQTTVDAIRSCGIPGGEFLLRRYFSQLTD